MEISKMATRQLSPRIPDILAVREDHRHRRKARAGSPISSGTISVYLQGGPRYRLDERTYTFTAPIVILIAAGTVDDDRQEGEVNGIFAAFHGHGLLSKAATGSGAVLVTMGTMAVTVPVLKEVSPADAQRIADMLRQIAMVRDSGATGRLRRVALLFQAIAAYCDAPGRTGGGVHREALRLRRIIEKRALEDIPMTDIYRDLEFSAAYVG